MRVLRYPYGKGVAQIGYTHCTWRYKVHTQTITVTAEQVALMEEERFFATEWRKLMARKALVNKVMVPAVAPIFNQTVETIVSEREEANAHNKANHRAKVAQRLAKQEQERQARAKANKEGVGPKGMAFGGGGGKPVTNPNSKKAQKQARKAQASKTNRKAS